MLEKEMKERLIKRANEILSKGPSARHPDSSEAIQFATSMLTTLFGPQSTQLRSFLGGQDAIAKAKTAVGGIALQQCAHAHGAIANAKAELEAGTIPQLRMLLSGEILSELVALGKEILAANTEAAKNVASVLVAAAFEDLMRRMGTEFAGVTGRPELQDVIVALKNADVLKGGQVGTAQSYLKFRNDSLHADWDKVDRSQVQSCIAFIEELLLKHFS